MDEWIFNNKFVGNSSKNVSELRSLECDFSLKKNLHLNIISLLWYAGTMKANALVNWTLSKSIILHMMPNANQIN